MGIDHQDCLELAEELEDQMHEWCRRQGVAFSLSGKPPPAVDPDRDHAADPAEDRAKVVWMTTVLFKFVDAGTQMPKDFTSALTLLDTFTAVTGTMGLPSWETMAAVVSLALKCGEYCMQCHSSWQRIPVLQTPEAVKKTEADILTLLEGRIRLAPPDRWASAILQRLALLYGFDDGPLLQALQHAMPFVQLVAVQLAGKVRTSAELPPRSLGLAACTMGLLRMGFLHVDETRPAGVVQTEFEDSLLWRSRHQPRGLEGLPEVEASMLAQAACCGVEEMRLEAFRALEASRLP